MLMWHINVAQHTLMFIWHIHLTPCTAMLILRYKGAERTSEAIGFVFGSVVFIVAASF